MPFQIIRNDITKVKADAIVNTANPEPTYASGTDGAIYKAAGAEELLAERKKIGTIDPGAVAVTPAFALSPSSKQDLVVLGCIQNGEYNLLEINVILYDFGLPELQKIK